MKDTVRNWSVAEAKQRLSELLRAVRKSPQVILNRGEPVAAVIDSGEFEQFRAWRESREQRSVARVFEDLRAIAQSENYSFEVPARRDRPSGWIDSDAVLPDRHKRNQ